jgi:hypothetical protein
VQLTDQEKIECRKYMGFPLFGDQLSPGFGYRYNQQYLLVEYRFNNLQVDEVDQVRNLFLPNLRQLEQDIYLVRDNSDTARAAVWYRNPLELAERVRNYSFWRTELVKFFGVVPLNPPTTMVTFIV